MESQFQTEPGLQLKGRIPAQTKDLSYVLNKVLRK